MSSERSSVALALALGLHPTAGERSPLQHVTSYVLRSILDLAMPRYTSVWHLSSSASSSDSAETTEGGLGLVQRVDCCNFITAAEDFLPVERASCYWEISLRHLPETGTMRYIGIHDEADPAPWPVRPRWCLQLQTGMAYGDGSDKRALGADGEFSAREGDVVGVLFERDERDAVSIAFCVNGGELRAAFDVKDAPRRLYPAVTLQLSGDSVVADFGAQRRSGAVTRLASRAAAPLAKLGKRPAVRAQAQPQPQPRPQEVAAPSATERQHCGVQ
eukprot:m51a1_g9045 hypothetical protein (274) ;mRNA; r:13109-14151